MTNEQYQILDCEDKQYTAIKESNPPFLKLYYKTILAFTGVEGIPVEFLAALSEHINYVDREPPIPSDAEIILIKAIKEQIAGKCGYKLRTVENYIQKSIKAGVLIKSKQQSVYYVNPFFIAKGNKKNINNLRGYFNFQNGKWYVRETVIDTNTGEVSDIIHSQSDVTEEIAENDEELRTSAKLL